MGLFKKKADAKPATENKDTDTVSFVKRVYSLLAEYRSAYAQEWIRQDNCEMMYRGDHWDNVPVVDAKEPRPVTPIIQSNIENISADLMDSIPQAVIKPEDPRYTEVGEVVNALIKQNHDAAAYVQDYYKLVHDLLTIGYCVQEVGYDLMANRGLGGAFIRHVDARCILFDTQAGEDIQDGRAVIKLATRTVEWLEQRYPKFRGKFAPDEIQPGTDTVLHYDQTKSVLLLEYWWREFDSTAGCYRVHMAQLAGGQLLADSRETKPEGYFADGEYPFVVCWLYRRKATPLGWGVVDAFREAQQYADKLDQIVMKNAIMASHNKLLVTESSGFDVDDLRNWSNEVHKGNNLSGVTWFSTPPLPEYIIGYIRQMRENVKDYSGANDFSRGNATGGITAAAAISALQEASSKRSRLAARMLYEAFRACVRKEIEAEREYNFFGREVYLVRDGRQEVATFESALLFRDTENGNRVPIEFMISIKVEQESQYRSQAQNENILQMTQLGILSPEQAVELMNFDGKESVLDKAAQARQQPAEPSPEEQQALAQQAELEAAMQQLPAPESIGGQAAGESAATGNGDPRAAIEEMMRMQAR